jgi:hypothetical protein
MSLLVIIVACWLLIAAFTLALMRMAALADRDAERGIAEHRAAERRAAQAAWRRRVGRGTQPVAFASFGAERRSGRTDRRMAATR